MQMMIKIANFSSHDFDHGNHAKFVFSWVHVFAHECYASKTEMMHVKKRWNIFNHQ